jgi:hypothetical protein
MWWCCNVPLTHVMPLQSTSTYVQWIPTVENVLESLLWGFTPVTLLAKHSTALTSRAWCHDSTFGVHLIPGRSPAARVTFPAQRGGENRSPRIKHTPTVESRHQRRYRQSRRVHHKQGLQEKNLSKARFSTFQVAQSKNTYMWAVLTHWLLQLRVNLHFPRRYWPMGCCFLDESRFTEGSKGGTRL